MYVKKIDWLDEVSKEAIVEVAEGIERLVCFSCPCLYKLNDMLREPLECLDTQDIVSCSTVGSDIKKLILKGTRFQTERRARRSSQFAFKDASVMRDRE